jgi:DNA gyrase subunit A
MSAHFVEKGDECILVTNGGQSLRFKESDIREMGRNAAGVRAIKLKKADFVVAVNVIIKDGKDGSLLVIMGNGYGKKTLLKEYKVQKRGGSGIKTAQITSKTGKLIAAKVISKEEEEEIVAISKKSQVIRTDVKGISLLGRQTQGVRIMKLHDGDELASLTCL